LEKKIDGGGKATSGVNVGRGKKGRKDIGKENSR